MHKLPRDEVPRQWRQPIFGIIRRGECIRSIAGAEQTLVRVHARPVDAIEGLRQEGSVQIMPLSYCLDGGTRRDDGIGHTQRISGHEVNLVLACGDLVMTRLDLDAEAT